MEAIGTKVNKQECYGISFRLQPILGQIQVCALKNVFKLAKKSKLGFQ